MNCRNCKNPIDDNAIVCEWCGSKQYGENTKMDYYRILGVEKNSSEDIIKKAYRELAIKYHPDKNPGNQEALKMFNQLKEAYEKLTGNILKYN